MILQLHCRRAIGALCVAILSACGGGGGDTAGPGSSPGPGTSGQTNADYFPLAVGNRWLYDDDANNPSQSDVVGTQLIGNDTAMVVQTVEKTGTSDSLYIRKANELVVVPKASDSPLSIAIGPLQRLRFPVVKGDRWVLVDKTLNAVLDFDRDGRYDTVTVHGDATVLGFETVTTPAGTYSLVAHVQTVLTSKATLTSNGQTAIVTSTSDDWYAPDIGPIRNVTNTVGPASNTTITTTVIGWRVGSKRSESVPPTVASKTPSDGTTSAACCLSLSVQFSEAMDQVLTGNSGVSVTDSNGASMPLTVFWKDSRTALVQPSPRLETGTYTARVTTDARDALGNPLATEVSWQFTVDGSGPKVTPVQPLADATEAPLNSPIIFTVDEDIQIATVNTSSVSLSDFNSFIDAAVEVSGRTVTMTPRSALKTGARYRVFVSGVADKYGNLSSASWDFTADPGRFAAPVSLITTAPVTATAIGDIDGDGRNDIVMATGFTFGSPDNLTLFVFRQLANGTYALPQRYTTHAEFNNEIRSLAVVDLDGNGRNEVVAGISGRAIEIYSRQNDGSLISSQIINTTASYAVRLMDMNGDGRPDIVGRPFMGNSIHIWRQSPLGVFDNPIAVAVNIEGFGELAVGDISSDGLPDIVLSSGGTLAILRQLPDRTFGSASYLGVPDGIGSRGVVVGDISGDGRNDIVVALPGSSSLGLFLQNAQGNLDPLKLLTSQYSVSMVQVADIDSDGRLDVVAASPGLPLVIHRQRTDGALGGAEFLQRLPNVNILWQALSVGDVNGDKLPDVIFADVWLRQRVLPASTPPAPGP